MIIDDRLESFLTKNACLAPWKFFCQGAPAVSAQAGKWMMMCFLHAKFRMQGALQDDRSPMFIVQAAPGGPHANAKVSTTLPPHFAEVGQTRGKLMSS